MIARRCSATPSLSHAATPGGGLRIPASVHGARQPGPGTRRDGRHETTIGEKFADPLGRDGRERGRGATGHHGTNLLALVDEDMLGGLRTDVNGGVPTAQETRGPGGRARRRSSKSLQRRDVTRPMRCCRALRPRAGAGGRRRRAGNTRNAVSDAEASPPPARSAPALEGGAFLNGEDQPRVAE
jgi:hypothetical protein